MSSLRGCSCPHFVGDGAGGSGVLEYRPTGWPAGSTTRPMAPVPSGRLKGNPGTTVPPELARLPAAGLDVSHLDVDDAVERADLALRDAQRPDGGATRDDLGGLIGALHRV